MRRTYEHYLSQLSGLLSLVRSRKIHPYGQWLLLKPHLYCLLLSLLSPTLVNQSRLTPALGFELIPEYLEQDILTVLDPVHEGRSLFQGFIALAGFFHSHDTELGIFDSSEICDHVIEVLSRSLVGES